MKNCKRSALSIVALVFALCLTLTGCAGRPNLTAEAFTTACEDAGFTVTDVTEQFDPATVQTALTVEEEKVTAGYFVFADVAAARSNYAQMLSDAKTGRSGEKFVDSSAYNRFYYSDGSAGTLLYRNGATLLYIVSEDAAALDTLIDTLDV